MKKFIPILIFLMCLVVFYFNFRPKPTKVFRIGTECDYPPNNWEEDFETDSNVPIENKKGAYAEGYDIQIAKLIAQSLGARLEVQKISWKDLIQALNQNEIDAIFSGMLDTKERKKIISFSDHYDVKDIESAIMVRRNGKYSEARNLKDFIGASIIAQKDSNFDKAIMQIKGAIHLPPAVKINEMFEKLRNKEADAVVLDLDSARTYERVYPGFMMVRLSEGEGIKFDFTGICVGLRNTDTKLLKDINEILANLSQRERQKIMDQTISRSW